MSIKITVLGTGTSQGVPVVGCQCKVCLSDDLNDKRTRSSIFIEHPDVKILIDIGPDFRSQFIDNQLSTLDAILITHEHNDHVIGLDDVRAINFVQKKTVPLYAEKRVQESIKSRFAYAFQENKYPGLPRISLNEITEAPFELHGLKIQPIRVMHGRLPILAFRIDDFAYITDANLINDNAINQLKGVKTLIINALRIEKHYSHFTLEEALVEIKKINPEIAYITHVSHNMGLTKEWSQLLPKNVLPLQDKMTIIT